MSSEPGDCDTCRRTHRSDFKAGIRGHPYPPCGDCPKYQLYPDNKRWPGLHPGNDLAWELYRMIAVQRRAGSMGGLWLETMVTAEEISKTLDEHDYLFPHFLARRNTFEKMMIINKIATAIIRKREDRERSAREATAQARASIGAR